MPDVAYLPLPEVGSPTRAEGLRDRPGSPPGSPSGPPPDAAARGPPPHITPAGAASVPPLALAGYVAATFFAWMDTSLLAPNLTAAGQSFGFSDAERDWKLGGELAFGYFVIAAPMALLVGGLADAFPRQRLLALVLLVGKVPCLLTYFVRTYPQLLVLRTLMGVTVGTVGPLASSLAGDMFPVASRTKATAIWCSCSGLGALIGQYIAGQLGPRYGWQLPFLVVALPGLLMAGVTWALPEPARGRQEEALRSRFEAHVAVAAEGESVAGAAPFAYQQRVTAAKALAIFAVPSNVLGFLQGVPGCIPWGVVYTYFNDFLTQEKGMSILAATQLMVVFGLANTAGALLGGLLGQRVYNRWKPGMPLLMGASTTLGILPMLVFINYPFGPGERALMHLLFVFTGVVVSITGGNMATVFLNVNPPEVRGTVFGIFCITDDVGKGIGPFFAAMLITRLGRLAAFNVCMCLWAACGLLLAAIGCFLESDERRMQRRLVEAVEMDLHDKATGVDRPTLGEVSHPEEC
eukprot:EG_transcript_9409